MILQSLIWKKKLDATNAESSFDVYATMCIIDGGEKLPYDTGSSAGCSVMTWRNGMGLGGRLNREGTYVYRWLIHADVHQKPTALCKSTALQCKRNTFLK